VLSAFTKVCPVHCGVSSKIGARFADMAISY